MTMLAVVGLLAGVVLAQRFTVFILIPGTVILLVVAVGAGIIQADTAWSILLMAASASIALQAGYAVGIAIRHVLDAPASERPQSSPGAPAGHQPGKKPVGLSAT
jgi:membrane protein DedA with SNARE-associated domain